MKSRTGSATTSGGSATSENSRNTIPRGNFATVCQKFCRKFIAQSVSARNNDQLTFPQGNDSPDQQFHQPPAESMVAEATRQRASCLARNPSCPGRQSRHKLLFGFCYRSKPAGRTGHLIAVLE